MANNFTPEQIEQFLQEFFTVVGRRQYIGARYVPMFGRKGESSIEWDNTEPYEPLTIVMYQGNSFTSKTYVPTGVAITDTAYWANTGNYNAQVEAYRQQVEEYGQQMEAIGNMIPSSDFDSDNTVKDYIDNIIIYKKASDYNFLATNSSADNRIALQNALNDSALHGFRIIVPKGTYNISSYVTVPWGAYICGESIENTILIFADNKGFTNPTDLNGNKTTVGATIKDLTIKGTYAFRGVPTQNSVYTYYEIGALYGTFYNCNIERINIQNFPVGMSLTQSPTSVGDYVAKYNLIYGDNRTIKHINISYCYIGMYLNQWDYFYFDFRVSMCFYIGSVLGYMEMLHAWNFSAPLYCVAFTGVNIELEYQFNNTDMPQATKPAMIVCYGTDATNNRCQFVNLNMYNLIPSDPLTFFPASNPFPLIRVINHGSCQIKNMFLGSQTEGNHGWSSLADNVFPCEIISCESNSTGIIDGIVHKKYTSMNNPSQYYNNIKSNIVTAMSNYELGISRTRTGVITYTDV